MGDDKGFVLQPVKPWMIFGISFWCRLHAVPIRKSFEIFFELFVGKNFKNALGVVIDFLPDLISISILVLVALQNQFTWRTDLWNVHDHLVVAAFCLRVSQRKPGFIWRQTAAQHGANFEYSIGAGGCIYFDPVIQKSRQWAVPIAIGSEWQNLLFVICN